jgi:SPIRAL1-like protein
MAPEDVDKLLKAAVLKDMRVTCRARGLSPAGGKEQLAQRLREHMLTTGDL